MQETPNLFRRAETNDNRAGEDGAKSQNGREQSPQPARRRCSRRKADTVRYWVEKTGSQNVRMNDVLAYATDEDCDLIVERLKREHKRDLDMERLVEAASGKAGELEARRLADGGYLLVPVGSGDSEAESAAVRGGTGKAAREKARPVGGFGERLRATIGKVFGR